MKTDTGTPSSPLNISSGAGPIRSEKKGTIFFLLISLVAFLLILLIQADLVLISFRSLFTAAALFVTAPEAFRQIFTSEILEFWTAALYLVAVPIILGLIARKSFRKKTSNQQTKTAEELSLGKISLRAFMRHTIALYASAIIFVLYSAAFLAPFIAPFSPYDQQDFLVTAYQPPLTQLDALILKQPKNLIIPLQKGSGTTIDLTNTLISDFQLLKTRNEPNAIRFVNEYRIAGNTVIYRQ
ncbi:MAG: ABC transporter permease, partial [Chlorobiaceae bacterium]|nr:ABC transporter permease [Chlorobiaceae bacterium]